MKHYLLLFPLLGAAALLSGCAVEPGYVERGPTRVYARGPVIDDDSGYGPEPVYYGGTTVIDIERDHYRDRDNYRDRDHSYRRSGRDAYHASQRRNDPRLRAEATHRGPRVSRSGGSRQPAAPNQPVRRSKDEKKKHHEH